MFSARNRPSSAGGVAPLLVYAFSTLVAAITPLASVWSSYQFQFSYPSPNISYPSVARISSFQLIFKVGSPTVATGDVMIFLDNVTLLGNSCSNCAMVRCPAGIYIYFSSRMIFSLSFVVLLNLLL